MRDRMRADRHARSRHLASAVPRHEQTARQRGITQYGYLLGHASCADGSHVTAPDPQGRGLEQSIRLALANAGPSQATVTIEQNDAAPAPDLGTQRYVYRYPTGAKLFSIFILLLIPVATAGFIQLALRPGSLSDRLIPAVMAILIIGSALFLAYRQAYFGWAVITTYERGLRFDFWRKHLVIPWTTLGKFYLGPGRMANWHITDREGETHPLRSLAVPSSLRGAGLAT